MRGSLKSWSGCALVAALGACSNIIGVSEIEIDPSLDTPGGGSSSGGSAAGSGEAGAGGEPISACPTDCDDDIACTVDECLPSGECKHTADDTACTSAAGKCTSCQVGIGCVDTEPSVKDLELLLDASLDEDTGDWADFSDTAVILPDASAQSGTHSAYFSAAPDDAEEQAFFDITQPVVIPAGTIKLTASGWYKMLSAAVQNPGRPRSDEYVVLTLFSVDTDEEGDYTRYWEPRFWKGTDPQQTAWKSFSYDAPKSVLAKVQDLEVTFDLVAETWDTTYYFDSLSLKATYCE